MARQSRATAVKHGSRPRPKTGPGRPQDQMLDAAILGAALKMVAEVGYERTSIEEVARRASTAKTSVYRRWPTKEAMVLAAVRYYLPASDDDSQAAARDTGSLRGDLLAHATGLARLLTRERVSVFAGLLLAMRTQPELAEALRAQLIQREVGEVTAILTRAVARGELRAHRPPTVLAMVLPSVLFTRMLVLGESLDAAFLTRLVDEVLVPAFRNA